MELLTADDDSPSIPATLLKPDIIDLIDLETLLDLDAHLKPDLSATKNKSQTFSTLPFK